MEEILKLAIIWIIGFLTGNQIGKSSMIRKSTRIINNLERITLQKLEEIEREYNNKYAEWQREIQVCQKEIENLKRGQS